VAYNSPTYFGTTTQCSPLSPRQKCPHRALTWKIIPLHSSYIFRSLRVPSFTRFDSNVNPYHELQHPRLQRSLTMDRRVIDTSYTYELEAQRRRPKYTRSKTGCLTCRQKKVKVMSQLHAPTSRSNSALVVRRVKTKLRQMCTCTERGELDLFSYYVQSILTMCPSARGRKACYPGAALRPRAYEVSFLMDDRQLRARLVSPIRQHHHAPYHLPKLNLKK
jgi:hypothetical protein